MILIYPLSETPKVIRKTFEFDEDVFIKARDFYEVNRDMRHHKVVIYKNGEPLFCLGYIRNQAVNVDVNSPKAQMKLSHFWKYSVEDEGIDYSHVDRYQMVIYEKLEEYSCHTARLIMKHNPDMIIAFTDPNARYLFKESDKLIIAESEEELFLAHPELKELRTLRGKTDIVWDIRGVFTGNVPSIEIMTGMYWLKREFSYGPDNPDKTFYLIKQPVKENGITALVSNVMGIIGMLKEKRPDFIPVVDLGVENDLNQFVGSSGEDVWGMFFKQVSPYSLQEVYNSAHVVLDQNSNLNMNPYLTEFVFSNQRAELKYGDELKLTDEVQAYVDEKLKAIFPAEKKRILAVVVRGSDYLAPSVQKYVPHGITAQETLEKAIMYVNEKKFDHVFLATEDKANLDLFMNSELKDRLIYVDQDRVDYTLEENHNKLLIEIYGQEKKDPYKRALDYICVLEAASGCDALLANVACGVVTYSLGRNKGYEFVDVRKI